MQSLVAYPGLKTLCHSDPSFYASGLFLLNELPRAEVVSRGHPARGMERVLWLLLFIYSGFSSFNKYVLSDCYVPCTMLDPGVE